MSATATLQRTTFRTSRLLEYFSEKELRVQTGHDPERWPEVIVKELLDNALDACEEANVLPEIAVTVTLEGGITVADNGPGLAADVVRSVVDFAMKVSSRDHYISPTRGQQGNALKLVCAIPFVLSDGNPEPVIIRSRGTRHMITVALDRIAGEPAIRHETAEDDSVRNGTSVEVRLGLLTDEAWLRFLPLIEGYSLFNPHAAIRLRLGESTSHVFARSADACPKWKANNPTSAHWYSAEQLRGLIAAYVAAERDGGPTRTVREFVGEFRGLSSTVKRKAVLAGLPVAGRKLYDLVTHGDIDRAEVETLLDRMRAASEPVKPLALGVLGEAHLRAWLATHGGADQTYRYKRVADADEKTGLPFVVEVAFAGRADGGERRLLTGLNFAPTLADPFRMFRRFGLGLDGLLNALYVRRGDPVTVVVHLTTPHLHFTDRGKSSLEAL
jgi:DNA topoisomerase VI subunit B